MVSPKVWLKGNGVNAPGTLTPVMSYQKLFSGGWLLQFVFLSCQKMFLLDTETA